MLNRFEKFNDAFVPERIFILLNLEIVLANQAIDQRQTAHHDGLWGCLALVIQDQVMNLGFMKEHLVRIDPLGVVQRGDFLAGGHRTLHELNFIKQVRRNKKRKGKATLATVHMVATSLVMGAFSGSDWFLRTYTLAQGPT